MKRIVMLVVVLVAAASVSGCTVISQNRMDEAIKDVPFPQLLQNTDRYEGETVILGGRVIEVRNQADRTLVVVLQTPLGFGQEPKDADRSKGRFMLRSDQFLDPEVFEKGRPLTVAGRVVGTQRETIGEDPYTYPVLEVLEIHLWETEEERYRNYPYHPYYPYYPSPFYDPWYDRHPWRGYRYW